MSGAIIKVSNLSKNFKLPHEKTSSIKSTLVNFYKRNSSYELQKALSNVNFEVQEGEFFGIVGRNGSGKSTLLKTLAGIYLPSEGSVEVNGLLTPFIELGVGFNPELTGRENIYLNGALLGFNRKEMTAMYEDIVEFAELERFMDQRLKNYSSGMQVRLAFSIAIRAKSDILLIDEVLAVGDEAFQRKCLDIFEKYKANKQTVILVTHDMDTVRKYCSRAMLLNEGKIIDIGSPHKIANQYSKINEQQIDKDVVSYNKKDIVKSFLKVKILNDKLESQNGFKFGEKMIVSVNWEDLPTKNLESIGVNIIKQSGEHLTGINSRTGNHRPNWKEVGEISIEFKLDILPGKYNLLVEAFEAEGKRIDSAINGLQFTVANNKMEWSGLIELPHRWIER